MNPEGTVPRAHPPPQIHDYDLLRQVGKGAYGEVWLARNVMGIYHAVKVVYRSDFARDEKFEREYDGVQRFEPISRDNVGFMDVLHVGRDDSAGLFYYVTELADDQQTGQQINPNRYQPRTVRSDLKQRGRLSVAECLQVGLTLSAALRDLHEKGLVHRDVKPSNIIFVKGVPKVADIGLVVETKKVSSRLGTPGYLAPEGTGQPLADIYSLGLLLYEMATGCSYPKLPDRWEKKSHFREWMELKPVVLRACEGDETQRYHTAEAFRSALEWLANKPARKAQRATQRTRWIAAVLFVVAVGFGFLNLRNRATEQSRRRELREIQVTRLHVPRAGWFSDCWSRLERLASVRKDQEVLEQATALLPGLDAREVTVHEGIAASSAAFGPDGRALVGGMGSNGHALLLDANGAITELPLCGEGPVCWSPEGVPLQLTASTNELVLRNARTGGVRQQFLLPRTNRSISEEVSAWAVTPAGRRVAAVVGSRILVWNASDGERLGEVQTEATDIEFSPDGSLLAVGTPHGTTHIYSVPSLRETAVLAPAVRGVPIMCLAFGRDPVVPYPTEYRTNRWLLATGDKGASIVVWDLERRMPRSFCRVPFAAAQHGT